MSWKPFVALTLALVIPACSSSNNPSTPGHGGSGKNQSSKQNEERYPPCHPGCFPAGTAVATPDGPRPIESLGCGDIVTLVGRDGSQTSGAVHSTFQTSNLLLEVRTDSGSLTTTETQPLSLVEGGFRAAGELKPGDAIWQWEDGRRARPACRRSFQRG